MKIDHQITLTNILGKLFLQNNMHQRQLYLEHRIGGRGNFIKKISILLIISNMYNFPISLSTPSRDFAQVPLNLNQVCFNFPIFNLHLEYYGENRCIP